LVKAGTTIIMRIRFPRGMDLKRYEIDTLFRVDKFAEPAQTFRAIC